MILVTAWRRGFRLLDGRVVEVEEATVQRSTAVADTFDYRANLRVAVSEYRKRRLP